MLIFQLVKNSGIQMFGGKQFRHSEVQLVKNSGVHSSGGQKFRWSEVRWRQENSSGGGGQRISCWTAEERGGKEQSLPRTA